RRGDVVGHAIRPRAQRARTVKALEASPQRKMHVLQQILPLVRVAFVRAREPLQRCTECVDGFVIQTALARLVGRWPIIHGMRGARLAIPAWVNVMTVALPLESISKRIWMSATFAKNAWGPSGNRSNAP